MKTLVEQLAQYAEYHRDKRNIATHFLGIPLIVVAVVILLSRPALPLSGLTLNPAVVVALITSIFYLKLDLRFGLTMALIFALMLWLGGLVAAQSTSLWLGSGIGLFVVGWIIQFIGHLYEQRKPAFFDDVIGLAIGPLFVLAEAAFLLGLRKEVEQQVEAIAGPTLIRSRLHNAK